MDACGSGRLVDLEGGQQVVPCSSSATIAPLWQPLVLLPDPFQRLPELSLAQGSCQVPPAEHAADPPNLKTAKDQGDQTQLEVSPVQLVHHTVCRAASFLFSQFWTVGV